MKDKTHRGIRVPWRYMIANHGASQLREWAREMQFFRFCRAVPGGHAADGDSLCLALKDGAGPQRLTMEFPDLDDDGRRLIAGVPVHIGYGKAVLRLSLFGADGDRYAVTAADVENALALEKVVRTMADCVIDPPMDRAFCIAPIFWPEFWDPSG